MAMPKRTADCGEAAEAKNRAEQLLYPTEKTLKELGDKAPSADKLTIENATNELRSAIESNDTARINAAYENLLQASYKLTEMLYQQASQAEAGSQGEDAAPGETEPPTQEDEEVIDAEFKAE